MSKGSARKLENLPPLSRLEQRIMGIVWALGECSSAEVIAENNKQRPRAETTIRTVLTNLRRKGYLELVPTIERQHRFRPAVTQEEVGRQSLKDLVAGLFAGSPRQALMYLIKDEEINDDDIKALRKTLQERKRRENKP
jgi:predicted transcriptional regulator